GESLLAAGKSLNDDGIRMSRVAGGVAMVAAAVAIFGGAKWWSAVDTAYQRTMYKASPLALALHDGLLSVAASDTQYTPAGRPSGYVPDHGKLMHLFLVGDRGFAHLHPSADGASVPSFATRVPQL